MVTPTEKRWEAVFAWKNTKSIKKAARQARLSLKATRLWVGRYKATGGVDELSKSGRPKVMSAQAKAKAYDLLRENEVHGAADVAVELQRRGLTPRKVSKSTVLRAAKSEGVERGQPLVALRGQPAKRLTKDTKSRRLAFALANKTTCWKKVMFTDRKRFLFSYPGEKVHRVHWAVKGTHRQAAAVNHPQCLNVYAGITKWGVTKIHVVAGSSKHKTTHKNKKGQPASSITASEYFDVVSGTFLPKGLPSSLLRALAPGSCNRTTTHVTGWLLMPFSSGMGRGALASPCCQAGPPTVLISTPLKTFGPMLEPEFKPRAPQHLRPSSRLSSRSWRRCPCVYCTTYTAVCPRG